MIKVGDSAEVVIVLREPYFDGMFKVGGCTIKSIKVSGTILLNGTYVNDAFKNENLFNQQSLYLMPNEYKKVGKLTITKVK